MIISEAFLGDVKFAVLVYGTSNAYTMCAMGPYCLEGFADYVYLGTSLSPSKLVPMGTYASFRVW